MLSQTIQLLLAFLLGAAILVIIFMWMHNTTNCGKKNTCGDSSSSSSSDGGGGGAGVTPACPTITPTFTVSTTATTAILTWTNDPNVQTYCLDYQIATNGAGSVFSTPVCSTNGGG